MIDLWWLLIPAFALWWMQHAVSKLKWLTHQLLDDLEAEQVRHLSTARTLTKMMSQHGECVKEHAELLRDIADSTKVTDSHSFIRNRIMARKEAKRKLKDKS